MLYAKQNSSYQLNYFAVFCFFHKIYLLKVKLLQKILMDRLTIRLKVIYYDHKTTIYLLNCSLQLTYMTLDPIN